MLFTDKIGNGRDAELRMIVNKLSKMSLISNRMASNLRKAQPFSYGRARQDFCDMTENNIVRVFTEGFLEHIHIYGVVQM